MLYSSSRVGIDVEILHPCLAAIYIIFNIIFTLVSVVFLNPLIDFDMALKLLNLLVCRSTYVCPVPDNVHVSIGEDKYFTVGLLTYNRHVAVIMYKLLVAWHH